MLRKDNDSFKNNILIMTVNVGTKKRNAEILDTEYFLYK